MISNEDVLKLETRHEIFKFIKKNPGLHLREISRRTHIPRTTLRHHINCLEKQDLLDDVKEKSYKRYYIKKNLGSKDKEILDLLRQEIPIKIFLYLLYSKAFSQVELSKELKLNPKTVKYYLKKMVNVGIIEKTYSENGIIHPFPESNKQKIICRKPVGREVFYRRKNDEIIDLTWKLLVSYKDSLPDNEYIDAFIEYRKIKKDIEKNGKQSKDLKSSYKKLIDGNYFFDFCRPFFAT